jgi:C-terminal processing protease CtpA/Prc
VIDVIAGTPAEKAGVKKGDKFLRVNGEDVASLTTDEVANKVRGPEGTQVTVTFLRGSQEVEFTITRARFQSPLVVSRMESDSIGYLSAKQLISTVADDMAAAARALSAQGATAWILDLRDDPGGELTVAVNVASLFVQRGTLVYQIGPRRSAHRRRCELQQVPGPDEAARRCWSTRTRVRLRDHRRWNPGQRHRDCHGRADGWLRGHRTATRAPGRGPPARHSDQDAGRQDRR